MNHPPAPNQKKKHAKFRLGIDTTIHEHLAHKSLGWAQAEWAHLQV